VLADSSAEYVLRLYGLLGDYSVVELGLDKGNDAFVDVITVDHCRHLKEDVAQVAQRPRSVDTNPTHSG
jgi:hypothetical protein